MGGLGALLGRSWAGLGWSSAIVVWSWGLVGASRESLGDIFGQYGSPRLGGYLVGAQPCEGSGGLRPDLEPSGSDL